MRRRAVLAAATARLEAAGVPSPRHDAEELLAHVVDVDRSRLVLLDEVGETELAAYDALLTRRAAREPLQHLTGEVWFRRVRLEVGPGVFTPRPETELLAGWAHAEHRSRRHDPRRCLLELPPVLHGQAEDPRHRWPRREVREEVRQEPLGQARRQEVTKQT